MTEALLVKNLGKLYKLYDSPRARLTALITGRPTHRPHWALADVGFALERGQCLGVLGDNGAGKSTLLKLVAGTILPTQGEVQRPVGSRITAILELGAGFHPEFTGRENLRFAGSLIGLDERELARLETGIIAFAEIEEAIDRPVKTYSSGMTVRLAFALVTAIEPDVLIIDEALAVGDQHFQKKCVDRINAFRVSGCTILFCSHSQYLIRQLCDVALWLEAGRPKLIGPTEMVLAGYDAHVRALNARQTETPVTFERPLRESSGLPEPGRRGKIDRLVVEGLVPGNPPFLNARDLVVRMTATVAGGECPNFGVMLAQTPEVGITSVTTCEDRVKPKQRDDGLWEATLTFPDIPLRSGECLVSGYLFDSHGMVVYDEWLHYLRFMVASPDKLPGLVSFPHYWT
jgi:lipopolysaccharide transport system ATP-binding protein